MQPIYYEFDIKGFGKYQVSADVEKRDDTFCKIDLISVLKFDDLTNDYIPQEMEDVELERVEREVAIHYFKNLH